MQLTEVPEFHFSEEFRTEFMPCAEDVPENSEETLRQRLENFINRSVQRILLNPGGIQTSSLLYITLGRALEKQGYHFRFRNLHHNQPDEDYTGADATDFGEDSIPNRDQARDSRDRAINQRNLWLQVASEGRQIGSTLVAIYGPNGAELGESQVEMLRNEASRLREIVTVAQSAEASELRDYGRETLRMISEKES